MQSVGVLNDDTLLSEHGAKLLSDFFVMLGHNPTP